MLSSMMGGKMARTDQTEGKKMEGVAERGMGNGGDKGEKKGRFSNRKQENEEEKNEAQKDF